LLIFRRLRWLSLAGFVLPVLLLRAAIPAGFMAASVDGALQIVLCQPQMMGGHHHHHHSGTQNPVPSDADPTCPYAQSTGPALMPALPVLPAMAVMHRMSAPAAAAQPPFSVGPPRQQSPRGPPVLA
jgi:hypothetical protein